MTVESQAKADQKKSNGFDIVNRMYCNVRPFYCFKDNMIKSSRHVACCRDPIVKTSLESSFEKKLNRKTDSDSGESNKHADTDKLKNHTSL